MTTSTSRTPVNVPAAARAHTKEGAIAFAQYVLLEADRGLMTANSEGLAAISLAECKSCADILKQIAILRERGERQKAPGVAVNGADDVSPNSTDDRREVNVLVTYGRVEFVDTSGKVVASVPAAGKKIVQVTCVWQRQGWSVAGFGDLVS